MAKANDNTDLSSEATAALDRVEDEQGATRPLQPAAEPRVDSAAAAALSVGGGAPAASTENKSATMQRIGIALVAVASVALIGVSAFFLMNGTEGEPEVSDVLATTVESSAENASGAKQTSEGEEASNGESSAANEAAPSGDASSKSVDAGSAANGISSDSSSAQASGSAQGSSTSDSAGSGNSAAAGGAGGSSAAPPSGGSSESAPAPAPNTVTVQVSVSSSAVGGSVSGSRTVTFNQGATVYDALCALGLSVNAYESSQGIYVAGIGGLAEKQHGPESGWKYSVNGSDPNMSCGAYVLHDGDVVAWRYVTSLGG